ncbi:MAG TPA: Uma2 family endonuclease [Stellaceae bacterium]|nr:Uma2 family endonuclease [Stellaceae bacterium]
MAEPATRRMTLDEFLAWDDGTDRRYELWAGVLTAMAPPMPRRGLLAAALAGEIRSALRRRPPFRVLGEAGVALPDRNDTFYVADLAIICEPLRAEDRLIRNPVLIVEILSPSTAAIDRQIKVPDYRSISSVVEILLIDSESAFAEVHRREGDRWITEMMRGLGATLTLGSVPLTILLSELYQGIPLPEQPASAVGISG